MTPRYAIYFAPAKASPWWTFGSHWLGRNEFDDTALPLTEPQLWDITAEPRRYGFHATLKAPFRLAEHKTLDDLISRTQALAANLAPLSLGSMQALSLGKFVALCPSTLPPYLAALAEDCVVGLDDLRAPLTEQDLVRRQVGQLDAREMELLHRYGYPYVLERFRFHFTLTGPVDQPARQRVIQAVQEQVAHMNAVAPLVLDRLCLFMEAAPGSSFRRIADVALSA
jgi:putative phosphonate metabolism protein